jgi:glycosyltransferase involved in cell wall biosynthesis
MRIGLDLWLCTPSRGGIGRYAEELTRALVAEGGDACEFVLFPGLEYPSWLAGVLRARPAAVRLGVEGWKRHRRGFPTRLLRSNLVIAPRVRRQSIDIFHSMDFLDTPLMGLGSAAVVSTIHDISPLLYPDTFTRRHALFFRVLARPLLRRADRIITVSQAAAAEILEWDPSLEGKLNVVYEGVSPHFRPASSDEVAAIRTRYGLPGGYILCVGTVQPRKNLARLIEAYALLTARDGGIPPLVIAGGLGWLYEPIVNKVAEYRVADRVKFLGFVPDADLPALFTGASLFVFPSMHEGFGLPVLEAMACGAPVVTSNRSALPEVAGDAAVLVDPLDVESIADGIAKILKDQVIARRLAEAGRHRAAQFTWTAAARKLLEIYRSCLA